MKTILAIPDLHIPFHHPGAFDFISDVKRKYRPDRMVCLGDEADYHAMSRWDHDPDGKSPGDEHREVIKLIKPLFKLCPEMDVLVSNHTVRPIKKAFAAGIPAAFIRGYREFLEAPAEWHWHDSLKIDGVLYLHGEGFSGMNAHINAARFHRMSTVIGHIHSWAGVQYSQTERDRIFGVNSGCLIDEAAYAFRYARTLVHKPVLGCTIIEGGITASFVPFKG